MEHHLDMVSCDHCKCQTRAGVSGDVNKSFECFTITDSKFYNRVLVWMAAKSTSINVVTIWLRQLDFCLHGCKWELPAQHIANCILKPDSFLNLDSLHSWHLDSLHSWHIQGTKLVYKVKFFISKPDSCWVPTLWCFGRTSMHTYTVFVVLYTQHI